MPSYAASMFEAVEDRPPACFGGSGRRVDHADVGARLDTRVGGKRRVAKAGGSSEGFSRGRPPGGQVLDLAGSQAQIRAEGVGAADAKRLASSLELHSSGIEFANM